MVYQLVTGFVVEENYAVHRRETNAPSEPIATLLTVAFDHIRRQMTVIAEHHSGSTNTSKRFQLSA